MNLAIMQPYFLPYIGYFQLIKAVDHFVFYDDVNFIKRGWINRTNIIAKDGKQLLSISLSQSSQNKLINEIQLYGHQEKILKTIQNTYKKAPYFDETFPVLESCIQAPYKLISEYAANSIQTICNYLGQTTKFSFSSDFHKSTSGYEKARRLIDICRKENTDNYINAIGGMNIYTKEQFLKEGVNLFFLNSREIKYSQAPIRKDTFESNLSIIDVLMFNKPEKVDQMLENYELI